MFGAGADDGGAGLDEFVELAEDGERKGGVFGKCEDPIGHAIREDEEFVSNRKAGEDGFFGDDVVVVAGAEFSGIGGAGLGEVGDVVAVVD